MKKVFCFVLAILFLSSGIGWAITAEEIVKHFEESQNWVKAGMAAFKVHKQASDERVADMFEFVSDKTYDYEGMIIDGSEYRNSPKGGLENLLNTIGDGVLAVIHKLATDDHKKLFKPTWLGFHTPGDKRVSNWFCLIMGNHVKTYLTRVDSRSKLDEIGTDPLQMNILDKNLFDFHLVKGLENKAILRITPKPKAMANFKEATLEFSKLEVGGVCTWYLTQISGQLTTGASGVTKFGNFVVAAAKPGEYIGWSEDGQTLGNVPTSGIATALRTPVKPDQKLFVFATQLVTTTSQKSREVNDYEITLTTNIKRLHINPTPEAMVQYITPQRLGTLEKVVRKVVNNHR